MNMVEVVPHYVPVLYADVVKIFVYVFDCFLIFLSFGEGLKHLLDVFVELIVVHVLFKDIRAAQDNKSGQVCKCPVR